jgi:putative endonuclease
MTWSFDFIAMPETYVYIVASKSPVLYVGVTNDLVSQIDQHKRKLMPGFTAKYNVNILVYYGAFPRPIQAIEAEKKIKGWTRAKKIGLIESMNPTWKDLYNDLVHEGPAVSRDSSLRSE